MRGRQALFTLLSLAVALAGAAIVIFPKGDIGEEAQLASLGPTDALARLDRMTHPLSPQLAFRQAELAAALGDASRADALLAGLAARTEDRRVISVARADLALRSADFATAARHLADALDFGTDSGLRQRLGLLYRRLGDTTAERDMLAAIGLAGLTSPERLRLIDLTAADGSTEKALTLAGHAATLGGPDAPIIFERFVAIALVTGAHDRLVGTVAGVLNRPDNESLVGSFAKVMATDPRDAVAICTAIVALAPDSRERLVSALAEAGIYGAARSLVQPWVASGPTNAGEWAALINYADRSGDIGQLEVVLRRFSGRDVPPADAFLPLVRYGGGQALLPYRAWLTADQLGQMPLVQAAWAIWLQRPDVAVDALLHAAQRGTDPVLWRALANDLRGSVHFERLRLLPDTNPALAALLEP